MAAQFASPPDLPAPPGYSHVVYDVAVPQADRQPSPKHEEEVVRVVVLVPYELALDFDDHDVMAVERGHCAR